MPPKRKGEALARAEETKRPHKDAPFLPEELVIDIIGHLPLPQIFSLQTLSKSIHNALNSPTQTMWKRLVMQRWKDGGPNANHLNILNNNEYWNCAVEYGQDNEKWNDDEAPYASVTGCFSIGKNPTEEDEVRGIDEASNERCKLIVQTWAIIEVWDKALAPLYYPNTTANGEPLMGPFYIFPEASKKFFKQVKGALNEESDDHDPQEYSLEDFHKQVMGEIKEIFEEEDGEDEDEEDEDEEDEEDEEGGKKKKGDKKEPNPCNFPRGSKAKWDKFPSLFWQSTKSWPGITSWHGAEIGPWENAYKIFWGQRPDNSVVGYVVTVDNM